MSSSDDPLLHQPHSLLFDQHSRSITTGPAGHPQIHTSQPATFSLTLSPASLLPLGPFTGYAAVLNRSKFLNPAQQLLEEACHVGCCDATPLAADPPEVLNEVVPEEHWKKARLASMINEVCRRYRMYYQQIQNVITSFERVAGLSTAAPYVLLALSSLSKHFRCLKNTICNQLNRIDKNSGKDAAISRAETSSFGMCPQQYGSDPNAYTQALVWRPQRGLPERAVAVLRTWLFEHFLHPYPTDVDKQMLAKQTGLTRNQVSNWFINARVRLWKPMVEEIHNLEMRELQKTKVVDINSNNNDDNNSNNNNNNNNNSNNTQTDHKRAPHPSFSTATCATSFVQRNQNPSARISLSNELSNYIAHNSIEEPFNYSYNEYFSSHNIGRNAGSVSLTLGLHQNATSRLPEPLSLNMALQFGIEDCNDAYVVGAFEGQDRRFGKDMISGHLMHDFVG